MNGETATLAQIEPTEPEPRTRNPKLEIKKELLDELCAQDSLTTMDEWVLTDTLAIIRTVYQSTEPEYQDEKLQRTLFCLQKDYYEKSEDTLALMDLIAKMRFEKERCEK